MRLIEKNADVNAATKTGTVPLHVAAQTGGDAIAAKLIERRARAGSGVSPALGTSDRVGTSDRAARPGADARRATVSFFLRSTSTYRYGAELDAQDASGNTALHYAAMIGFPTFVNALLKNGASVKLTNGKRQIPADVAADGDIAALLKKSATA